MAKSTTEGAEGASGRALERLEQSRRRAERELDRLRRAVASETGHAPRMKVWGLPLIAFAAGLTLAYRLASARRSQE